MLQPKACYGARNIRLMLASCVKGTAVHCPLCCVLPRFLAHSSRSCGRLAQLQAVTPTQQTRQAVSAPSIEGVYMIVGLGNPGTQYQGTRHNVGYRLVEALADQAGASIDKQQNNALVARGFLWGQRVLFAKPTTFMNLSGQAVSKLAQYYKVPLSQVLVVTDDLDLPPGTVRLRSKGGHGGHNGMRSIVQHWGGQTDFPRLRIGIGRPPGKQDVANYVLQGFAKDEQLEIDLAIQQGKEVVQAIFKLGMEKALSGSRV